MKKSPINRVSVLLVCRPGLDQKSLTTAVNAIPMAEVIAKADDVDSALRLVAQLKPNVLLVNANSLQGETLILVKQTKALNSKMTLVVLTATTTSTNKTRLFQEGADFVLAERDLDRDFTQILSDIQAHPDN